MIRNKLETVAQRLQHLFPNGSYGLNHGNDDFLLYVSIVLAAQSQDKVVNQILENFPFKDFNELSQAEEYEIYQTIKKVGYASNKAKYLKQGSKAILNKGKPLKDYSFDELISLPGIGMKSAAYIRWVLHNDPEPVVDTHMRRVISRLFMNVFDKGVSASTDDVYKFLKKYASDNIIRILNNTIVDFGRHYCSSKFVKCDKCELRDLCDYYEHFNVKN